MVVLLGSSAPTTFTHPQLPPRVDRRPHIYAAHYRDGQPAIVLCIELYEGNLLGPTHVVKMPSGHAYQVGKWFDTCGRAAQMMHRAAFGEPTDCCETFSVYVKGDVDLTVLSCKLRDEALGAQAEAHARTRVHCMESDAGGGGMWLKLGQLLPLMSQHLPVHENVRLVLQSRSYRRSNSNKRKNTAPEGPGWDPAEAAHFENDYASRAWGGGPDASSGPDSLMLWRPERAAGAAASRSRCRRPARPPMRPGSSAAPGMPAPPTAAALDASPARRRTGASARWRSRRSRAPWRTLGARRHAPVPPRRMLRGGPRTREPAPNAGE